MKEMKIKDIKGLEILDSRGNPTIEVEVILEDGSIGTSMVPSGASTGSFEAYELRDNDNTRYLGKGVLTAVNNVNEIIKSSLIGLNVFNQIEIDRKLIGLDETENKSKLGANAILGVSLAVAKAASNCLNIPLYRYLGGVNAKQLPIPMMNVLNGGKHADSTVNIQEFMIMPTSASSFKQALRMCTEVYHSLKILLKEDGYTTSVGDEGGFAPNLENDEQALKYLSKAVEKAGYILGTDFMFALDIAATEMYEEAKKIGKEGYYYFWKSNILKTPNEMIEYFSELSHKYSIISLEDCLSEEDFDNWTKLTSLLGNRVQLVGDDLFVTNIQRLKKGIKQNSANSILIKLNQIGTLTESLDVIEYARQNGYKCVISHRSGETEDTTIADLAVALNVGQIKSGAPCRTDRVSKYNRLIQIEDELGNSAKYNNEIIQKQK